ncbi:hypothetical protein ACWDV7_20550 [Streptomyces sp. NPDC003362]
MSEPTQRAADADLARQALAAARAAARTRPDTSRKQRARTTSKVARGTGHHPVGLDGVLKRPSEDQGWSTGLEGGSILDRWQTLCPPRSST